MDVQLNTEKQIYEFQNAGSLSRVPSKVWLLKCIIR